jgi:hypothetical protein
MAPQATACSQHRRSHSHSASAQATAPWSQATAGSEQERWWSYIRLRHAPQQAPASWKQLTTAWQDSRFGRRQSDDELRTSKLQKAVCHHVDMYRPCNRQLQADEHLQYPAGTETAASLLDSNIVVLTAAATVLHGSKHDDS